MADSDQTEQLGLDLDDRRAPREPGGPSEAFQTAVGAVVVLFVLVAVVGGALRLFAGDDQQVQLEGSDRQTPTDAAGGATADPAATPTPTGDAAATPGGAATASPGTEPNAGDDPAAGIIAEAPAPGDTPVQLLDGVGDQARVDEVRSLLEGAGYPVVATSATRSTYASTTVLYEDGAEPAARALQARDARFSVLEPAPDSLTADVQLHVVVGQDWATGGTGQNEAAG